MGMPMGGPPVPPDEPSLNAYPGRGGAFPGRAAAVPKMVFQIERALDTLASAVPGEAKAIDRIRMALRDVLTAALESGASEEEGSSPMEDSLPEM